MCLDKYESELFGQDSFYLRPAKTLPDSLSSFLFTVITTATSVSLAIRLLICDVTVFRDYQELLRELERSVLVMNLSSWPERQSRLQS